MLQNRRQFLRKTAYYGLGAATAHSVIETLKLTNALAQPLPGYKALVCIFMGGGNDANNMIVPISSNVPLVNYAAYAAERAGPTLAIPQANLLPINVLNFNGAASATIGLHSSFNSATFGSLQAKYNAGKLAVVCNCGPLVFPMTQAQYIAGSVQRPFQLFSHSDQVQQYQTCRADQPSQTGWGGRTADTVNQGGTGFPEITSIAGSAVFTIGVNTRPLAISPAPALLNQVLVLNGFGGSADEIARRNAFNFLRTVDRHNKLVQVSQDITQQALDVAAALNMTPTISTTFPGTGLGNQLLQVARVIKANRTQPALGLTRQIFFVSFGGFDTHSNQRNNQGFPGVAAGLLGQLSDAMNAFYDWSVQEGWQNDVTTFTLADFGRTFNPAGSGAGVGSDHGWGNHQLVLGGSVIAGLYGKAMPGQSLNPSVFPTLKKGVSSGDGNTHDVQITGGRGRWIPSASVEQYANTLASWYGLAPADAGTVFPLLSRFTPASLGFMA